jgi:hypothetical protein
MYSLQAEEDSMFWGEPRLQALSEITDTLRLQDYNTEGSTAN